MSESKIYRFPSELTVTKLGDAMVVWLRDRKKMTAEGISAPNGYLVQAKVPNSWKRYVGLDAATQVQLIPSGDQLVVNAGAGKWADKAAFMGAGLLVFPPLAIPAAVGAVLQGHLPLEIFDFIERYIVSGGATAVTVSIAPPGSGASVQCPLCAGLNEPGSKFCRGCGGVLAAECPHCSSALSYGAVFCSNCGTPYTEAPSVEEPWVPSTPELVNERTTTDNASAPVVPALESIDEAATQGTTTV